jgi:hypothetical protein
MAGAFLFGTPLAAQTNGCDTRWADAGGYDIVCDDFPDNCGCPDQWQLDNDCAEFCGFYDEGLGDAGCAVNPFWQCEMFCSCQISN